MPFSPTESTKDWAKVYEKVFRPAIEKSSFNYVCRKSEIKNVSFSEEIIKNLKNSDLVLADLTDYNPNVMWELGIRHTISTKTIMICQKEQIDNLPSDIRHFGVIGYGREITDAEEFKEEIEKMLSEINSNSDLNTSPVRNVLNAEDIILSRVQRKTIINKISGLLSEFMLNLKVVEDFISGKLTVNSKNISFRRFHSECIMLLRNTNYFPFNQEYLNATFNLLLAIENANMALDKAHFNSKDELEKAEKKVKNNSNAIKEELDFLIPETNTLLKKIKSGGEIEGETIISYFTKGHEKLIK